MPTTIDDVELDETNEEFKYAADFVSHTDKLIYLTGKAGTGKTTFLKLLKQSTLKKTVILAPTGVAAVNAGGQTIHSFFKIRPSVYVPNDRRLRMKADTEDPDQSTIYDHFQYSKERLELVRQLELLIIDEISMVRCDLLDVVDRLLRVFRRKQNEPFGGVQVILIGDTFQLAPIAKRDEWDILKQFYKTEFFFGSKVIEKNKPVYIELKKIYRQNEREFIELLNKVRVNQINQSDLNILNHKYDPTFIPARNSNYITLATHNVIVYNINRDKLSELPGELKLFDAVLTGDFPDNIMPTDRQLQLKEDAQIMFIKNDRGKRFYSGKIAKISTMEGDGIKVEFSDNSMIYLERETWNNVKYSWDEKAKKIKEEVVGTFTQFPIKLAWAITVHKSQGLTFEKVVADIGGAFASGQVYVALSRCTAFNGLVLKTRIDKSAIITDPQVLAFAQNETPSTLIMQELNSGKANYYYKQSREAIRLGDFGVAYDHLLNAIKFRNDIETAVFKRYCIITFSRLVYNRENARNISSALNEANRTIDGLRSERSNFQHEIKQLKEKLEGQNRGVKLLLDKTKELEAEKEQFERSIATQKRQIDALTKQIGDLTVLSENKVRRIQEMKTFQEQQEKEISRLKNLKWYDKLLRKS